MAINSERLKFAHAQENDQLKSIGLDAKKLQNWPASASSRNDNNILAFKLTPASLPNFFSAWFTCGHSEIKSKKLKPKSIVKSDDDIVISFKTSDMRSTRKGIAEWINEKS